MRELLKSCMLTNCTHGCQEGKLRWRFGEEEEHYLAASLSTKSSASRRQKISFNTEEIAAQGNLSRSLPQSSLVTNRTESLQKKNIFHNGKKERHERVVAINPACGVKTEEMRRLQQKKTGRARSPRPQRSNIIRKALHCDWQKKSRLIAHDEHNKLKKKKSSVSVSLLVKDESKKKNWGEEKELEFGPPKEN